MKKIIATILTLTLSMSSLGICSCFAEEPEVSADRPTLVVEQRTDDKIADETIAQPEEKTFWQRHNGKIIAGTAALGAAAIAAAVGIAYKNFGNVNAAVTVPTIPAKPSAPVCPLDAEKICLKSDFTNATLKNNVGPVSVKDTAAAGVAGAVACSAVATLACRLVIAAYQYAMANHGLNA